MTQQDWQRIRELFDRAVSMDGADRAEYVRKECADSPELLAELEKLLAADNANRQFGSQKSIHDRSCLNGHDLSGEKPDHDLPLAIGANVEGYLLEKVIGLGVSGVVYQAVPHRTKPVNGNAEFEWNLGPPLTNGDASGLDSAQGKSISDTNSLTGSQNLSRESDIDTESRSTRTRVAIKALYPWNFDRDSLLRYDREREALSRLHHPNLARFIRAGKTDGGVPYLIMELIEGRSLHELIEPGDGTGLVDRARPVDGGEAVDRASAVDGARTVDGVKAVKRASPVDRSLNFDRTKTVDGTVAADTYPDLNQRVVWMIQTAEGVQMAHQKLILHRDLKPANVIINRAGDAVLTDFGLAKFLGPMMPGTSRTSVGKIMGTPQYMAPEQVLAQEPTMATDVYGLGGVLYFLLTGRPPFDRPSFYETCEAVKNGTPLPPSRIDANVPRDLETICLKCLAREPEKRYRSVDALLMDLQSFSLGEPIAARSFSAIERLGYWARRNRLVASASVAMVVLGLVALSAIVSLWWKAETATAMAERHLLAVQETNQRLLETIGGFSQSLKVVEKNPATLKLQLEWLTNINESYEKLPLSEMEPAVRHDAAVARYKLGLVQRSLGMRDLGFETLEQAEAMFRELAQEEPDNFKHWFNVFHCLTWRGQSEEAYRMMVKVDQMSGGEVPVCRDALAHAELRRAGDFLGMSNKAGAEELISRALGRVEANLRDDPENGLYWKKLAECYHYRARLDILKGERVSAFALLERAGQSYDRASVLLNSDIQTLRQWLRSDGLRFSLQLDSRDWEKARAVLKSSETLIALHSDLISDGIDYHLVPAKFQEQRFILALAAGHRVELLDCSTNWLIETKRLSEVFPEDALAQCTRLYALQMVDRFLPEMDLDSTIAEFRAAMAPLEEPLDVTSEAYFLQMVAEYVAGNKLTSQTMAEAYIVFLSTMAAEPEVSKILESEIPHLILDEPEGDKYFAESKRDAATLTVLRNRQMSCWEDHWRHWFVANFIFGNSDRK